MPKTRDCSTAISFAGLQTPSSNPFYSLGLATNAHSRFVTDPTACVHEMPSKSLRNRAVKFGQTYRRFFHKLGGASKRKKSGRQAVWLTPEVVRCILPIDEATRGNRILSPSWGTTPRPVGIIADVAPREHAVPESIHLAAEGNRIVDHHTKWFANTNLLIRAVNRCAALPHRAVRLTMITGTGRSWID